MQPISIPRLAKQVRFRKELGDKPYLLFLGAGVSISSGVSNMNDTINRFLIDFGEASDKTLEELDRDVRFERFISKMEVLNEDDKYFWLQDGFKNIEPSPGYIALTRLIEEGYFDVIFTTNWDNLLDLSLERSFGIKNKRDFRFYVRGVEQNDFIIRSFRKFANPRIKILKLHGELDSRVIFVTLKETNSFPKEIADLIKEYLRDRHLIMIGYCASDEDVRQCIESSSNTLIYVNPKPPTDQFFLSFISKFKEAYQINGQDAEFDFFMNNLAKAILEKDSELALDLLAQINVNIQQVHDSSDLLINYLRKQRKR